MLTGERRWVPGRRGGMTVLGKVTVPKPINLPSQRLENHGLDPNVEIVPKGTLNWGTRPPSSAQNAWASPAQSPPKTGGLGSPSHLNGRPSSGGSGTRPSTAGSDKSHESVPNVWGSSSRPSSASGVSAANQTSLAASRPRSAEPRPASSQLSRFAEPIFDNSVAWGPSGTLERLAISSTKGKDFSLSTGDFPTLGSEKTTESPVRQGHSSHGRPVSASGRAATPKQFPETSPFDDGSVDHIKESGAVNTSQNSNFLEVEPGDPPNSERWQRETKPFPDQNMPQQYGPWNGPLPHNPSNGGWFRGPYGGPPYGPPPGGYPPEPFPYYHPRFPARPAANMQPVLQQGAAPSGYFSDKGDAHRPHMPESYGQPVMPYGPGPYPVPLPYDGYYGPPPCAASCIPGEQRPPVMGMATGPGPCVYNNTYPIRNVHPDHGNFRGPSGYGAGSGRPKEQMGSSHPHGIHQGPYKLLKHQDGWDDNDSKERREQTVSIPSLDRDSMPEIPTREISQGADQGRDEQFNFPKASPYGDSHGGHSPVSVAMDLPERKSKINKIDNSSVQKQEVEPNPGEDPHRITSTKRNPTLIEKIESLNNKARMSDGRYDEKLKSLRASAAKAEDTPYEAGNSIEHPDIAPTSGILPPPAVVKRPETVVFSGADVPRQVHENQASVVSGGTIHRNQQNKPHSVQSRSDNRGKGKPNPPKDEEWRKKPHDADLSAEGSYNKEEISEDNVHLAEKSIINKGKGGDVSAYDNNAHQRVKFKETVAERAKKLQKEEEERTREQKARALAKLEELNRRTLAEIATEKKVDEVLHDKRETPQINTLPTTAPNTLSDVAVSASGWDCDIFSPSIDHDNHLPETRPCPEQNPSVTTNLPSPLPLDVEAKNVSEHYASKAKPVHKRKQNMNKNSSDKAISNTDPGYVKSRSSLRGEVNASSSQVIPNATDAKPKKKNNRNGKSKHKVEEVPLPKVVPIDANSMNPSSETNNTKTSVSVFEVGSVQVPFSIEIPEKKTEDPVVSSTEEVVNNPSKPHPPPRRTSRTTQGTRPTEKFHGNEAVVWAPVGSLKKNEASEDPVEVHTSSVPTRAPQSNNNKSRRAEMERYVPKPVAKELSQQGNSEVKETSGPEGSFKPNNKPGKMHGLWRPRASGDSLPVQEPFEQQQISNPNEGVKDQRTTSRGKRQSYKGQKGTHSSDQSDLHGWETPEENHAVDGHGSTQWQPKTPALTTNNHQRTNRGPSRGGKAPRKDFGEPLEDVVDTQQEQSFSGPRRGGYQNRVGRVHEVDNNNSKQQVRPNNGRRRNDSQYEYRGRANGSEGTEMFEEGSRGGNSRYRETVPTQTHPKHARVGPARNPDTVVSNV